MTELIMLSVFARHFLFKNRAKARKYYITTNRKALLVITEPNISVWIIRQSILRLDDSYFRCTKRIIAWSPFSEAFRSVNTILLVLTSETTISKRFSGNEKQPF